MIRIKKQTKEEKNKMYMKCSKSELIEMLINCNDIIDNSLNKIIDKSANTY